MSNPKSSSEIQKDSYLSLKRWTALAGVVAQCALIMLKEAMILRVCDMSSSSCTTREWFGVEDCTYSHA